MKRMNRRAGAAAALVVACALLVGCAPANRTGVFTILDDGSGPQLCEEVMESYPPQCNGTPVVEWDWDAWPHEEAQGVRWGEYSLTVTPEGDRVRVAFLATPTRDG